MDAIPPVSEHEFYKRFYACHEPRPAMHFYHKCKKLGAHSHDLLSCFPKKKSELEESGDEREVFWGIYAREIISLRWVLFYNSVCVAPLVVFFFLWIFPMGFVNDLQNAAIPVSMMVAMLSLFWSVFLGSLQHGRSQ